MMEPSLQTGPDIDPNILNLLEKFGEIISFKSDEDLVHKGHIPKFSFILLDGRVEIHLSRSKKELLPFSIVGIKEVMFGTPLTRKIRVFNGTKVLKLSKLSIIEALKNPELSLFISQIINN